MTGIELSWAVVAFILGYIVIAAIWPSKSPKSQHAEEPTAEATKPGIQPDPASDAWYVVLEVDRSASLEDITAAYRTKIMKYHPDKVTKLGPELQKVANDMTQKLNRAYEMAQHERRR